MDWKRKIIYFIVFWIFLGSLVNRYIWNSQIIVLLPDVLVVCLFLYSITERWKYKISNITGKTVLLILGAFLIIGTLSSVIHLTRLTNILWGLRMVVRYPLLFYLVYQYFSIKDVRRLKKAFYYSFWLNTVFVVQQLFTGAVGDQMGGIWIGNGDLANYILMSIIIYGGDYYQRRLSSIKFLFKVIILFACAVWAEIKLLYFVIPLMLYIQYCFYRKSGFSHILIIVLAYIALIPLLKWGLSFYYNQNYVDSVFDMDKMEAYTQADYGFSGYSYNRGTCVKLATEQFLADPIHLLIGHGIGSATISQLFSSEIAEKYADSTRYYYFTSSYVLIETGWGGFVLYLLFYLLLFKSFFKYYRHTNDPCTKYWSITGCMSVIYTFIMIYYNNTPYGYYYMNYLVWAFCYIVIREQKRFLRNL